MGSMTFRITAFCVMTHNITTISKTTIGIMTRNMTLNTTFRLMKQNTKMLRITALRIITLSIMTQSIMTQSIMTLGIITFSTMTRKY
jgi:hypothetical protein